MPGAANPQAWNRYSYALNNPILYNDPDGHFPVIAIPVVVPFVALAAVIVLTAIAIHPDSRAAAINSMEYMSGRTRNLLNQISNQISIMTSGGAMIVRGCKENPIFCRLSLLAAGGALIDLIMNGGIDEDESNTTTLHLNTLTPSLTPPATSTPPNTSTSTPSCPPYNECPNTPTSTPPVLTPTPPIYTPAPGNPGGPAIPI